MKPFLTTRKNNPALRFLLLGLILLAFFRVTWSLDANALWWDESLTLQRAELPWPQLIQDTLVVKDGFNEQSTTDQHPFFFFAIVGVLIRLAGENEYVLRFPSVLSATLLVPVVWVMAMGLQRRQIVAQTTPFWAALFAATSPFYLWYGQEARPYALWAVLALLSTYLLWRAAKEELFIGSRWSLGYLLALTLFVTTQYYALFLLPLHALLIWASVRQTNPRLANFLAAGIGLATMLLGGLVGWYLLSRTGGENFERIPIDILLPDLLNAYSLGLSVNINQVWWLDLFIGFMAILGVGWAVRSWKQVRQSGWLIAGFVLIPLLILLAINAVQPAYMNARHMSLIGGGYLLAVGAGVALLWSRQRWLGLLAGLLIIGGASYSTLNYFTVEAYGKDDYRGMAAYFAPQMQPGDLILLQPAASWRIFEYYLPVNRIHEYNRQLEVSKQPETLRPADTYGVPLLFQPWEAQFAQLQVWKQRYRRIWFIKSGTNPFVDPDELIETWLNENMYLIQEKRFFSHSALRVNTYMAEPPVFNQPITVEGTPLMVNFDDQIRLVGLNLEQPLTNHSPLPITLTWQAISETDLHYKSILRLIQIGATGEEILLGITEREPYGGTISTAFWASNQTIVEYTEIPTAAPLPDSLAGLQIRIQLYPDATKEKAPIVDGGPLPSIMQVGDDGQTLVVTLE